MSSNKLIIFFKEYINKKKGIKKQFSYSYNNSQKPSDLMKKEMIDFLKKEGTAFVE